MRNPSQPASRLLSRLVVVPDHDPTRAVTFDTWTDYIPPATWRITRIHHRPALGAVVHVSTKRGG